MAEQIERRHPGRVAALVCVLFLVVTGASTWATARVDDNAEHRLLQVQTKQAAAVLSTAILLIQEPLTTALNVQRVAEQGQNTTAFTRLMTSYVAPDKVFVSASLWQRGKGGRFTRLATVGVTPAMKPGQPGTGRYLGDAFGSATFTVKPVQVGDQGRIAYALADPGSGFVIYAERAIPADRRSPVDRDSAFSDLHYAIYVGPRTTLATLSTTDVEPSTLPLDGSTAKVTIPFGSTVLTLVTSPRRHLGASLGRRLPLILLLGGLLLSLAAARASFQLVRRRQEAEDSTSTITGLYDQVGSLYGQQRELSERLQRALLPQTIPELGSLEIAADYVAGAQGVDIGGDWYSIIGLGDEEFAFVVGDVSGRGIDSVAVMAHARFTVRAYLLDGDSPAVALEKCSHQFDISVDGHITTAVVGVGNRRTGEITIANAGHPTPLLISEHGAAFVPTPVGPPLGTGSSAYESVTVTLTPGSTLFCFTDGLVERRNEDIDAGMQRLAGTVQDALPASVADLVEHSVRTLRSADAPDDIAVLAIRWSPVS